MVKINLALSELPNFTADPGTELAEHHTGSVEMAPSIEYMERAFQDAREGRRAERPFSDGVIPTTLDRTLCPDGTHIMSLFTQWVPKEWSESPHTEELEAYADRMIDCYDEVAPNFKASILHRDVVGPYEMEQEYGLIGGNIFHGELSVDQLFHMRPAPGYADYRTPIAASTTAARGRTPGAACAGSRAGRRPRRRWPTRRRPRDWPVGCGPRPVRRVTAPAGTDTRGAVRAMLEPRRVAVVGASGATRQLRRAAGLRSGPQPGPARGPPGEPAVRHHRRPTVRAVAGRRSRARSTWYSSECRTMRVEEQMALAARRGDRAAVLYGSLFDRRPPGGTGAAGPGGRHRPCGEEWPCAAAAAWDSST